MAEEEEKSGGMFEFGSKGGPQDIRFFNGRSSEDPVVFRAFLTSFSDKYASNWNETPVFARMDPIYTYQNTTRVISFGIDVPAYGILEARDNLEKFSKLVRMIYPTYSKAAKGHGLKTSPIVGIKFGNLISDAGQGSKRGLFGILGGVEVTPEVDAGFFMAPDDNKSTGLFPKLFKASFEFKPLHSHLLGDSGDNGAWPNFPYNMVEASRAISMSKGQAAVDGTNNLDIFNAVIEGNLGG
mgnify:CR=1 FL=1